MLSTQWLLGNAKRGKAFRVRVVVMRITPSNTPPQHNAPPVVEDDVLDKPRKVRRQMNFWHSSGSVKMSATLLLVEIY